MSTVTLAGQNVDVDAEGFLINAMQWQPAIAEEIARESGIDPLTERHWEIIDFMRKAYFEEGAAPSVRALAKSSGVPVKELYELFPKGPAKLAAKIAGVPKPRGCI